MGIQLRVAALLADTSWTRRTPSIDHAIARACGHQGMPAQELDWSLQHAARDAQIFVTREFDKESARLSTEYAADIGAWDWSACKREAESNLEDDCDNTGTRIGRVYLGSVLSLAPSGKYYTPWCTNQSRLDCLQDEAYFSELDSAAEAAGGWIENGEGDACDLYFCISVDAPADDSSEEES